MAGRVRVSGFLDEISDDLNRQFDVANELGIFDVELRSAFGVNVLKMTPEQHEAVRTQLKKRGMGVSAIGSPVGKVTLESLRPLHGPEESAADLLERVTVRYDDGRNMSMERYLFGEASDLRRAHELADFYGTRKIRAFSFWVPEGSRHWQWRNVVREAVNRMGEYAAGNGLVLGIENERKLFGNVGVNLRWLFNHSEFPDSVGMVFDPSNFTLEGERPIDAYRDTEDYISWLHVKDSYALKMGDHYMWVPEEGQRFALPGEGGGQIPEIMAKMRHRIVQGSELFYCTMEPHLQMSDAAAGETKYGGKSGPENFAKATKAFMRILDELGIPVMTGQYS